MPMLGAEMPEASIDKHRYPLTGEHYIRTDAGPFARHSEILPKPKSATMEP